MLKVDPALALLSLPCKSFTVLYFFFSMSVCLMFSQNTKTIQKLSMSTFFHSLSINLLVHGAFWSKISRQSTGCWWITGQRWTPVIMVTWTPGSKSAGPQNQNTLSFFSYPSNSGGLIWASMLQGHFCLIKHGFFSSFLTWPFLASQKPDP